MSTLIFQVLDHGIDHEEYWTGCGLTYTPYQHVVTGIGNSPNAAGQEALERFYRVVDRNDLTTEDAARLEQEVEKLGKAKVPARASDKLHNYVSIRWRLGGKVVHIVKD